MRYQVGQRVTGRVNNVTDLGIFVTLPKHVSGLIHYSDFGNNWAHERINFKVNDPIRVVVINNYKGKTGLSKTRINDPGLIDHTNQFSNTKKENFLAVLTKTNTDAQKEIRKLQQELVKYAN